jgi:hypothetical protein
MDRQAAGRRDLLRNRLERRVLGDHNAAKKVTGE